MTGPELKRLRESHNLTQIEFADLIRVHQSQVSRWERGKQTIRPSMERLIRMEMEEAEHG